MITTRTVRLTPTKSLIVSPAALAHGTSRVNLAVSIPRDAVIELASTDNGDARLEDAQRRHQRHECAGANAVRCEERRRQHQAARLKSKDENFVEHPSTSVSASLSYLKHGVLREELNTVIGYSSGKSIKIINLIVGMLFLFVLAGFSGLVEVRDASNVTAFRQAIRKTPFTIADGLGFGDFPVGIGGSAAFPVHQRG